ncbi:MAG: RagB/SusD family nutrient uptake outer membrane protein [Bacteroides sp.]|nr:RagB/SusD family nutrient uptake outer membrane protein [Bacteroides sp.]
MKKIKTYIAAATLALGTTACSGFMDTEVDLTLSEEQVFSSFENTRSFLANIYTYLPDAFAAINDGSYNSPRDCMTDNALCFWPSVNYYGVINDSYSASNHPVAEYFWPRNCTAIRAANKFLANVKESVVGNYDKDGDDDHLYDRYKAEARLLRALFHLEMVGYFGDFLIIGDDENGDPIIYEQNDERMNIARTDAAEVLEWIAEECDAVKDVLPFRYSDETENWGRVNGAAAYALKARALLYRASPLNNTSNNTSWWQEAAEAAQDFIDKNNTQSNPYVLYTTTDNDPDENYYECFITNPYYNDEYILTRSVWTTYTVEFYLTPCGFSGTIQSNGRTNPTQNLVDSYEMASGVPIDASNSGYDAQNPYANRDPRLEQTILHHGSIWGDAVNDEEREVDVSYPDGADYQLQFGGTLTGYYTKKFLNNMSFKSPTTYNHVCPIFRYGEVLLNAAEAYNEAYGPEYAYEFVNEVRARVGMPAYSGMTQDELRERIQNERRIELVFEDHRFFDERRWKLFENQTSSSETSLPRYQQLYNLYGVTVTPDASTVYTYGYAESHPSRAFNSPKNYYFPIPEEEYKKLPNLGQNTGW